MTEEVREIFQQLINKARENKAEPIVDGMHGFLFITNTGTVTTARECGAKFRRILKK